MSDPRDDDVIIESMVDAIIKIFTYTAGQTFDTFSANPMMKDAVAKNLEVVGESASQLSARLKSLQTHIPWDDVIGMRHRLVHHYGGTDWAVVWETIRTDLTPVLEQLSALQHKE